MNDTSISIFKCKGDYLQTKSRDVYRTTLPTFQSQEKTREIHIDGISQNTLKPNQTLVILYKTDCDISGVDLKDSNLISFPKQQKHGLNVLNPKDHPIFLTFLGFLVAYCLTNLLHIPLSFLSINYRLLIYALNTFLLVLPSIFYCHRYKIDYKKVYRLNLRAVTFYSVIRSLLFNVYIIFFYYLAALLMLKQEVIATRPLIVLDFGNVGEIVYVFITVILVPAFCQGIAIRGFLLNILLQKYDKTNAIWIATFLYAFLRFNYNFFGLWYILDISIFYNFITIRTNSTIPSILCHMLNNTLSIVLTNSNDFFKRIINKNIYQESFLIVAIIESLFLYIMLFSNGKIPNVRKLKIKKIKKLCV